MTGILESATISAVTKEFISLLSKVAKSKYNESYKTPPKQEIDLEKHLTYISSWSESVQIFGMARPVQVNNGTVPLKFDEIPRRFKNSQSKVKTLSETDLLNSHFNYLLLGDPGSGKTTTIKRLARKLLMEESSGSEDIYQYPLVVRLRDLESCALEVKIINEIGLSVTEKETEKRIKMAKILKKLSK